MKNKNLPSPRLAALKTWLTGLTLRPESSTGCIITTGATAVDECLLQSTSEASSLHEIYAENHADAVTAHAFALGVAMRVAVRKPIVWAFHEMLGQEAGHPYGPGMHGIGLALRDLLLVRVRDAPALLAVGEEALRNPFVGVVLLSAWGEGRAFTLTASRRLKLAARRSGVMALFTRAGAVPVPSAAETRWSVRAVASVPLEGSAPGRSTFSATLLRHRGGGSPKSWVLEWDRERQSFREAAALRGDLVPVSSFRSPEATEGGERWQRTG